MKIAEKTDEEFQSPSVNELRYSGRQIVDFIGRIDAPNAMHPPADRIKAAVHACHCARHDATDYASSVIAQRLDLAREQFGASAVKQVFPEYPQLVRALASVREQIAAARKDRDERDRYYCQIEVEHLPEIMKLFELFRASEGDLEDGYVKRALVEAGTRWGWIAAIAISLFAWWFPIS